MSRELRTVTRTAQRRRASADAYLAALVDARNAGASLAEIGRAAGVHRNVIFKTLRRLPKEET